MDEQIDVLDERGRKTGEVLPKREIHERGLWHRCFHCWVLHETPEGRHLLLQRRSHEKETWPGWLDVSVAGHISAGETSLEGGVRELREEVGLDVDPRRLVPLGTRRVEYDIPLGRDRELHDVFLLTDSTPLASLRLQREEVDSIIAVPFPEAAAFASGELVDCTRYGHAGHGAEKVSISDFVAGNGDYVGAIVAAAEKLLAGGAVGEVFRDTV